MPTSGVSSAVLETRKARKLRKSRGFCEAAEGIRTLDLLYGKHSLWFPFGADIPCKRTGFACVGVVSGFPGFHLEITGVWAPNGHPRRPSAGRDSLVVTVVSRGH